MYCKRKGGDGRVMLYTATKQKDPNMEQCNADGSPIAPPVESSVAVTEAAAVKTRRRRAPSEVAVQDYASGAVIPPEE